MSDNRRTATRHDVDIPGRCKHGVTESQAQVQVIEECRVGNLSMGGAYILLRRLGMGERVTLWFRIPTHDAEIEAAGTVRWSTDQGIGIQFDGLRARETWALGKYFESLQSS